MASYESQRWRSYTYFKNFTTLYLNNPILWSSVHSWPREIHFFFWVDFKGTVSRDFLPLVFSSNSPLDLVSTPLCFRKSIRICLDIKFKFDSRDVTKPLSQQIRLSLFLSFCLKCLGLYSSCLLGFCMIFPLKIMRACKSFNIDS